MEAGPTDRQTDSPYTIFIYNNIFDCFGNRPTCGVTILICLEMMLLFICLDEINGGGWDISGKEALVFFGRIGCGSYFSKTDARCYSIKVCVSFLASTEIWEFYINFLINWLLKRSHNKVLRNIQQIIILLSVFIYRWLYFFGTLMI